MALVLSRDGGIAYNPDVMLYSRANIPGGGVETQIIYHVVPLHETHIFESLIVGGNDKGQFVVYVNSTEILRARNAWTTRTLEVSLGMIQLHSGDSIEVRVQNDGTVTNVFEARLQGKQI